ncbi:MAG: glycogen synthase GlgA [Planctomycetaceae bacterium]
MDKLRIVLAASEAVPFSKTGGLADVSMALAKALNANGHDVTIIIPDYRQQRFARKDHLPEVSDTGLRFTLSINSRYVNGGVNWTMLPGTDVKVLLVTQADYFDRKQLYMEDGQGYPDNCERFCFFSQAVMEVCQQMLLRPDILHCNDWQTGLIPALLNARYASLPGFENTASVMTLHNMAYQGRFWHLDMALTSLPWRYFNMYQMEMWGDLNLLKTGIAFADQITTVSPTYADEICTPEGGEGLDTMLRHRRSDLIGILNGIDVDIWDPESDPLIPAHFSATNVQPGKSRCKAELQRRMGLPERDRIPLFGMVSRMSDQKGFDLLNECAERLLLQDIQMVFLGTGDPRFEIWLQSLMTEYPTKVAVMVGFDESLAHQIEAGADAFLMPSRFEPCGLNQMYSLRYGTVPVVQRVGGLADSVVNTNESTLRDGTATGFVFDNYDSRSLAETVERAIDCYRHPDVWKQIMAQGMKRDWSWDRSAHYYVETYRRALERRHDRELDGRR